MVKNSVSLCGQFIKPPTPPLPFLGSHPWGPLGTIYQLPLDQVASLLCPRACILFELVEPREVQKSRLFSSHSVMSAPTVPACSYLVPLCGSLFPFRTVNSKVFCFLSLPRSLSFILPSKGPLNLIKQLFGSSSPGRGHGCF